MERIHPPFSEEFFQKSRLLQEEREKLMLPAAEVKNQVVMVNPGFKKTAPFNIRNGKPMPLAAFFTPTPEREVEGGGKIHHLTILPESYGAGKTRSGQWGAVVFRDNEGRIYRDVDVKGVGDADTDKNNNFKNPSVGAVRIKDFESSIPGVWGIADYGYTRGDWLESEKLLKKGVRTYRILAIALLEEIIDEDGKRITIEEAKTRGLMPQEYQPVVAVRAFGTRERVIALKEDSVPLKRRVAILEDARAIVAQELGIPFEAFTVEKYAEWFAKELGRQMAKLRNLKRRHGYISIGHNITLDCRIVDLDSVEEVPSSYDRTEALVKYKQDHDQGLGVVRFLSAGIDKTAKIHLDLENLKRLYEEAYYKELKVEKGQKPDEWQGLGSYDFW